ncbi:MAG: hypothetical protein V4443_12205 [Pseudomonadota bacterium]
MVIETIPIQGVWLLLRRLPGFLLKRYFTQERLAQLIYVDVRPRHDSAEVHLGQTAYFNLYLQVINLSPFSVELDRASFRFWFGGGTLDALILKKQTISSGELTTFYISGTIPDGHANQMARLYKDNPVALDGNIEFNCRVRPFAKTVGHLDGINAKVYNANVRSDA